MDKLSEDWSTTTCMEPTGKLATYGDPALFASCITDAGDEEQGLLICGTKVMELNLNKSCLLY